MVPLNTNSVESIIVTWILHAMYNIHTNNRYLQEHLPLPWNHPMWSRISPVANHNRIYSRAQRVNVEITPNGRKMMWVLPFSPKQNPFRIASLDFFLLIFVTQIFRMQKAMGETFPGGGRSLEPFLSGDAMNHTSNMNSLLFSKIFHWRSKEISHTSWGVVHGHTRHNFLDSDTRTIEVCPASSLLAFRCQTRQCCTICCVICDLETICH